MINTEIMYDKSSLLREVDFNGVNIDVEVYRLENQPIHFHKTLEIIMILEGTVSVKMCYERVELIKGEFVIINTYELHSLKKISEEAVVAAVSLSQGLYSSDESILMLANDILKKQAKAYRELSSIIWKILYAVHVEKRDSGSMDRYGYDIKKVLENNFKLVMNRITGDKERSIESDYSIDRLNEISDYLYLHFDEPLTLESVARELNMSKYYLSHFISSSLGISFKSLLNLVRADRAEFFILEDEMPVNEICFAVRFSSIQYFNKNFKYYFGCTPAQYRRLYRKETIKYKNFEQLPYELTKKDFEPEIEANKTAASGLNINLNHIGARAVVVRGSGSDIKHDIVELGQNAYAELDFDGEDMVIIIKKQ